MLIDRRQMFGTALGLGAAVMAAPSSQAGAAPMTYEEAAGIVRAPLQPTPRSRELVRFATLAANSHNTQPWIFTASADRIVIAPDLARRCPAVDPDDHHLFVSLGCAAENLVLAASMLGLKANPVATGEEIVIDLETTSPVKSPLADAITVRQSTRTTYDGRPVSGETLRLLESACREPGVSAIMLTDRARISNVADYVVQGNSAQMRDKAFMDELQRWLRFSEADAMATMDGLFSRCSGNPALPAWIARPLLGLFFTENGENRKYREQIESSAGIVVLAADAGDKAHWIAVGRACQRFGLQATALGLKYAFINQPVEVAAVRSQFASFLNLGERRPDIIMRFGAGPALPNSLRRAPEQVMREGS
ncbi:nitroreductase family protein [Bradyrhizobium sp. BRP22]|uniref:Acg family FMN-binding oxidoreductase n=1 Tax=Bradyrhizobium sp. BRP22 TaxID=2793821 RepID=UPI001CD2376F|nr:Tat pathway signal protein [Bradyrhizobium sp. BRP22]MCA1454354.1 nitroreductase family protein [Bradyrhizobium sp. BRP22]